MTADDVDRFIERVRRIDWMTAPLPPTTEAEALLGEHVRRMAIAWRHLQQLHGFTLFEADVRMSEAGSPSEDSDRLTKALFQATLGAPVREHLVFNLHSYFFWTSDAELASLPNPFEPLLALYELGYTTAGGPDETAPRLEISLGWRDGIKEYVFEL